MKEEIIPLTMLTYSETPSDVKFASFNSKGGTDSGLERVVREPINTNKVNQSIHFSFI